VSHSFSVITVANKTQKSLKLMVPNFSMSEMGMMTMMKKKKEQRDENFGGAWR
jgi:hypothetical protein